MDAYKIQWKKSAVKELEKIHSSNIPRIIESIQELIIDPQPMGSKKLKNFAGAYRIRIGDYRVVYSVEKSKLIIEVIRIAHRKEVYR